ncbi:hypothetical protein [Aquimarina sp. RZ0]|uniref:hypothetical protein n=1 Tax=Aquimarina sp. RZ0 TaxID=2607730 RepID=UPI0011F1AA9B|nr:hypothetical protein [Aquimarina sp. RZ0]KAA1244736.1 hypothetical protein F0000_15290 [Aquimarina sp. RZ0]
MKNTIENHNNLTIVLDDSASKDTHKSNLVIDKKLKKIEQLKKQISRINNTINTAKKLYDQYIEKEDKKLLELKEQFIIKLYERFNQKAFALWQKEMIESRILNEVNELFSQGYESEKIAEIHEEITRLQSENMDDFEKEMMNEMAKEYLKNMGVNIDEENFNFEDFANPEFREKFQQDYSDQQTHEYHNFYEQEQQQKHREQQQKVKTTDKDFQKLYKTLVKKAHPDLVIDPLEKEKREEWMKKLSSAWEERNYYELLVLQKEIDADSSTEVFLNSGQLEPLIKQLNEEISKLESDKYLLKHHNPDTSFYYESFHARSEKGILKKIMEVKGEIHSEIDAIKQQYTRLKTQKSTKELLLEIRDSISGYHYGMVNTLFHKGDIDDEYPF